MKQTLRTLSFPLLALLAIVLPLITSHEIREWTTDTLLPSQVYNAQPIPPFSSPHTGGPALRFMVVGDVGTGGQGQRKVAESMSRLAESDSTSFVLLLGDNFYERGVRSVTDLQWLEKFESVYYYPSLQIPFLAVLGNHDYFGTPQAQVDYSATSNRWVMPSRFYSRLYRVDDSTDVAMFLLDTNSFSRLTESDISAGKDSADYRPQLRWLESELSKSKARWKIVAGHHTVYSNGEHGNNPALGSLLEPLFVHYGVDFYLAGHDHNLELLEPVRGIYYIVSGAGGKDRSVEWRENTVFAATRLGFVRMTVTWKNVVVEFYDREGTLSFAQMIPQTPTVIPPE